MSRESRPGRVGLAVPDGEFASGAEAHTTNQRMEVTAALEALRALWAPGQAIEVVSDSTYVVNCFRDRWWVGWQRRGWKNSQNKPVVNRDLWEPLIALVTGGGDQIRFRWVKGHATDQMNAYVDALALEAATLGRGSSGRMS